MVRTMNNDETPTGGSREESAGGTEGAGKIDREMECGVCGARWVDKTDGSLTTCPSCGRDDTLRPITSEFTDDPTLWLSGAISLAEIVSLLQNKAEEFSRLEAEGWELDRSVRGESVHLTKRE